LQALTLEIHIHGVEPLLFVNILEIQVLTLARRGALCLFRLRLSQFGRLDGCSLRDHLGDRIGQSSRHWGSRGLFTRRLCTVKSPSPLCKSRSKWLFAFAISAFRGYLAQAHPRSSASPRRTSRRCTNS